MKILKTILSHKTKKTSAFDGQRVVLYHGFDVIFYSMGSKLPIRVLESRARLLLTKFIVKLEVFRMQFIWHFGQGSSICRSLRLLQRERE